MTNKLKDKKVDIIAYSLITTAMLVLAISFFADAKKDPYDQSMRVLAVLSTLGTCIAGGQLGVDIKQYHDMKNGLAQRTKENQK